MFSKVAEIEKRAAFSLTSKLMLLYSLSTLSLLLAIGLFLYPTFATLISHLGSPDIYIKALCYKKIITALLLSAIGTIILGKMIAKNGLKGIRSLTSKIELMTVNSLHEPLCVNELPSELKVLGEQFNLMLGRMQASFNQLYQFSSDIAHELRNPLHNLQLSTEMALTKKLSEKDSRSLLEVNLTEYQHLSKLVENLLFLARSDQSAMQINKQKISVHDEILSIMEYYQSVASESHIKMDCEGDGIIFAESTLFRRVISNLLSNSLKYTLAEGQISVSISSDDSHVLISVSDTGIGIEKKHLSHLFDRFYRVDPARSQESGGLGLGLAIVKSIVELHQGKVAVTSQPNQGTTIKLSFPSYHL